MLFKSVTEILQNKPYKQINAWWDDDILATHLSEKRQLEYYNMISTTLYVSLLFTFFGGFQVSKTLQIKVVWISFLDDFKVEEYLFMGYKLR